MNVSVPGVSLEPAAVSVLWGSPLFAGMSKAECRVVAAFLETWRISQKIVIFGEGDAGDKLFILLSGKLNALVRQIDGIQRLLFTITPGDFFGEMSVIAREPRSATVIAAEDVDVVALKAVNFYRIILEYPSIGVKILKNIMRVQNSWLEQSARYLGDLTRWGENARRRAITDELTGLYNRLFIEDSVRDRFKQGSVGLRKMSLMMMDLDKVHAINEQYGVQAGDIVIIMVADVLKSIMRSTDISARLSGDEFAVFLPDTDISDARRIAERIREMVRIREILVPVRAGAGETVSIRIRISIGIAVAPTHANSGGELFASADKALRRAKEQGRDRVELAD
ncbi:MAG: GGDEF domain-containing protein [Spirochaetaceae bacterium]|jgi:diguanylate cyclase (GGDEF)-like protein|nr:GGDEF domain-containing protein [Spirochaetaceae bacterium]